MPVFNKFSMQWLIDSLEIAVSGMVVRRLEVTRDLIRRKWKR